MTKSTGKYASGMIYIQTSRSLLGRLLKENPAIHNLSDRGCKVFKIGKSMDKDARQGQLRNSRYAGANDWVLLSYDGEECCYPFTAALWNEQKLHKFVRGHTKITHLTQEQFPWLYDRDGHSSEEVYFGPPKLMAAYIKACFHSTPEETKAFRDAREALSNTKAELASEAAKLATTERRLNLSNNDLMIARSEVDILQRRLEEQNSDFARMKNALNIWRKAALAFGGICILLSWWILKGR